MRELRLELEGMHCPSCAMLIEEEVEQLEGVGEVKASYPRQQAKLVFDDTKLAVRAIVETIGALGYHATVAE